MVSVPAEAKILSVLKIVKNADHLHCFFPAFFCLVFGFIMSTMSLSLVHERLPDRKTYGPLPDISFDLLPEVPWALDVSEIIIMVSSNITFLIMLFHKHR